MPRITDYSFLFQDMLGKTGTNLVGSFKLSQINSSSVQAQLKAAGINSCSWCYDEKWKWYDVCKYSRD